ncbi:MAG: hypothetical protein NW237_05825 [Cyanobacteriota bacterium]|nr:hypothetical protein [Cyanobacteriota bacterium]
MATSLRLDLSVQQFFADLNWDNYSQETAELPIPFLSVEAFWAGIPWAGQPFELAARSLAAATDPPLVEGEAEEGTMTLSDLVEFF